MINSKELWDGLSDFWTSFENRSEIEDFWTGMLGSLQESADYLHKLYISKYLEYSKPVWENSYINIKVIKSGPFSNKINGQDVYPLSNYKIGTFDIPSLKCVETGQQFTQGSDYEILEEAKIKFKVSINSDPYTDTLNMFGEEYFQSDPTIYTLYRRITNLEVLTIDNKFYHPFTYNGDMPSGTFDLDYKKEKAILLKYMSWGIYYLRTQIPTLKNLRYLYNIMYNLPFSYDSGTVSVSGNSCTIGDYTYYIDSGSWSVSTGDTVEKFQPLVSGVEIKDRINDPGAIASAFNALQAASSIIVNVSLQDRSKYMNSVIDFYKKFHKPKNLNIKYNVS